MLGMISFLVGKNNLVLRNNMLLKMRLIGVCVLMLQTKTVLAQNQPRLPEIVTVPAGEFISGSSVAERELAYQLDENAYGHSITRTQRWYDFENEQQVRTLPTYSIMKTPVTRCDYALFVADTDHPPPRINKTSWDAQGLKHPYKSTIKFQWNKGEQNDKNRCHHPVVLVSYADVKAYANWLSDKTGLTWRLPSEFEWEKAARGVSGYLYPWGNQYDPLKLNSHDAGPFDTLAVGTFKEGASPFGLLDAAGQVFEWTSTGDAEGNRSVVKGGSWDDKGCGVCRPAARHYRANTIKHILVGFRLVKDVLNNE